ncbi:MAG: glycine cleavage system protein GcvH [Candidatus Omnitrophica bacterium]|jgi:glycine cleavage system H protein|nr:glycine cleavage system protein GcvH [Candidatus Omnitrophota bacterium]
MSILKFSKTHEWAKIDKDTALIGISEYAQKSLGDIVFIELPKVKDKLKQAAQFGTIESTKAASELYSPLSGEVLEINKDLINNPQWVNESPQDKGWMVKIKIGNNNELSNLMDEAMYKDFVAKEAH